VIDPSYTLERKAVKHINLRVRRDGSVVVSAPPHVPRAHIDDFVQQKRSWIDRAQRRMAGAPQDRAAPALEGVTTAMCEARFRPLVADALRALGEHRPVTLRIRTCKTRYGSCNPHARRIMINRALYHAPQHLLAYVVLHECAHLKVPNHGAQFHALMRAHMPDYPKRRQALRRWQWGG
jgi:predicted metal-dependent hydrolase